jgi:hypothetical protein
MPDLRHLLQDTDLDFLTRVARAWGVELPGSSFQGALDSVLVALSNQSLAAEILQALPADAQAAWQTLLKERRIPAARFMRQFGELRVQGEGWRKREEPDLHPGSTSEILWYRALIGRGIFDSGGVPTEYIYVPDEFLEFFGEPQPRNDGFNIRPADAEDHAHISYAAGGLVDQLTTLLAELRKDPAYIKRMKEPGSPRLAFELALLSSAGLIDLEGTVEPEKSRQVLEKTPGDSLLFFFSEWRKSESLNDLRMLPGLIFEGSWTNSTRAPRELLLKVLQDLGSESWWSIAALVSEIKAQTPDFQRPAGDYDSWFIRRLSDGQSLRGFDTWDDVEGALLRYLLRGPLFWLGWVELGATARGKPASSFKISPLGASMIRGAAPNLPITPAAKIKATREGLLILPPGTQPTLHYQVARFGELEKVNAQGTTYALSSRSLERAREQGLKPTQLTNLLKRAGANQLPPALFQLLERYEKFGAEARLEKAVLLSVADPALLETLQKEPKINACLDEVLSPTVVKVSPGREATLVKLLAELGLLAEVRLDV